MTAAALIAQSSQFGLILKVVPPDGLKIDFEDAPPPADFVAELRAEKRAIIERLRSSEARPSFARASSRSSRVPIDENGLPVFDTGNDHQLGDGIVARAIRNQRQATLEATKRAREVIAVESGEVWLRGAVSAGDQV